MVDPDTLASILNNLRGYLKKLAILAALPEKTFLDDFTNVESTKHLLQVSIECCLDIAHHIVADEGFRTPTDYYDTFVVLREADFVHSCHSQPRRGANKNARTNQNVHTSTIAAPEATLM